MATAQELAQLDPEDLDFLSKAPGLAEHERAIIQQAKALKGTPRPAQSTTVPLTPERQEKVRKRYEETKLPEGPVGGSVWEDAGKRAVDQAASYGAEALRGIGAAPWLEAAGDLGGRAIAPLLRIGGPKLPNDPAYQSAREQVEGELRQDMPMQRGSFDRISQGATYPSLSKVVGMTATPLAAATAPVQLAGRTIQPAGQLVQGVAQRALAPANKVFSVAAGQAPGLVRTGVASGTTGLAFGANEALARRVPDIVTGNPVEALRPIDELLAPGLFGGLMGVVPGAMSSARQWATNPKTETGIQGTRWAANQQSGRNAQLEEQFPRGNIGVKQAKEFGDEQLIEPARAAAKTQVASELETAEPPIRARTRQQLAEGKSSLERELGGVEMDRGRAAAGIEPRIDQRFTDMRKANNDRLVGVLDAHENSPVMPDGMLSDIRQIVAREASPASPTVGKVTDARSEVHTPYGRQLQAIESYAREYMPPGQPTTVRGVRNFIKYLKTVAESGTPEKAFPAKQILGAVRDRLGQQVPEVGDALAEWKVGTDRLEAARKRFYGSEDIHKQGIMDPRDVVDAPETGEPTIPQRVDPGEQLTGRRRLMGVGRLTPDEALRAPDREALVRAGFGQPIDEMMARNAELDTRAEAARRASDEAAALTREAEGRELARTRAGIEERAQGPIRQAESEAKHLVEDKFTQEAGRWRGNRGLLRPVAHGVAGAVSHSPVYGAARAADAALGVLDSFKMPLAGRLALHLPEQGAGTGALPALVAAKTNMLPSANIPGSLDFTLTLEPRDPKDQVDQLINGARGQRLRATIGDQLRSKEERR